MKSFYAGIVFICLFSITTQIRAQEVRYPVKHDHLRGGCKGELIFGPETVEYKANDPKRARVWQYEDIQQIGLLGPKSITVLTYEDNKWKLGKDRIYRFEIIEGEVTSELWTMLQKKVTRPLVSAVIPTDLSVKFKIPVKHQRGLGGSNGILGITDEYIVYRTEAARDARIWRYEDISSIGSTGPYQLRVTTTDRTEGEIGGDRNFVFAIKERLSPQIYDFIWWKINGPQIEPPAKR
jgi:hypothetical protein